MDQKKWAVVRTVVGYIQTTHRRVVDA